MPVLRLLGGDQFRKFCVVSMTILVITVWITCWTQEEKERESRRIEKECVTFPNITLDRALIRVS